MKRLKYRCLFGGKQYPIIAAYISVVLAPLLALALNIPENMLLPLLVILPAAALIISFYIEHRLDDTERAITEQSVEPLWYPITEQIADQVRTKQKSPLEVLTPVFILGGTATLFWLLPVKLNRISPMTLAFPIFVWLCIGLFVVWRYLHAASWKEIDATAVYTVVPIHHMYDVEHRNKYRRWYKSYLVFYLPDGRYVLPAPEGSGSAKFLIIVKFRDDLTWFPYYPHEGESAL